MHPRLRGGQSGASLLMSVTGPWMGLRRTDLRRQRRLCHPYGRQRGSVTPADRSLPSLPAGAGSLSVTLRGMHEVAASVMRGAGASRPAERAVGG